jgi:capsular polysaccharide transport system permease protein
MSTSIAHLDALSPPGSALGPLHVIGRRRGRRWRSLLLTVLLPTAAMAGYMYYCAADQYVTEFRFSVRHQTPMHMDTTSSSALSAPLSGGSAGAMSVINDSQIVIQYLKSRQVIDDMIAAGVDLDAIYAGRDKDFLAHLHPAAPVEERLRYWRRMIDPFFDITTGVVSVEVRAFRPEDARAVAAKALALAEKLINDISTRAHADMLAYARSEVASSETKLKAAQAAISDYRNKHAVLFPEMQAISANTVEGQVRQNLIEARTAYSAQLGQGASADTAHMRLLASRIAAMEAEIKGVHGNMAQSGAAPGTDTSLASVLSGYGVLQVEEQIAAKVYERARIAMQDARYAASEQAVYLAAFVQPGLPQDSTYPLRWRVMLETVLVSFAAWCLLQLLYHGIRDHID